MSKQTRQGRAGLGRPTWSVMIPTYRPPPEYLAETIHAVLAQRGSDTGMEVVVVDDASPDIDTPALVRSIAGDSVRCEIHRDNRGLAVNWNRCIARARGQLIHILHQDDVVRPGFYSALEKTYRDNPNVGMVFCRHELIDGAGISAGLSNLEKADAGVIPDWLEKIASRQRLQCPSVVVPKRVYSAIGPFRDDLRYIIDWEMWIRIAARFDVAYVPEVLAAYRVHGGSETSRLTKIGVIGSDFEHGLEAIKDSLRASKIKGWRRLLEASYQFAADNLYRDISSAIHAQDWSAAEHAIQRRLRLYVRGRSYRRAYAEFKWMLKAILRNAGVPVRLS
jgi:glycosyltransferase involved in cell wall biosynthesis